MGKCSNKMLEMTNFIPMFQIYKTMIKTTLKIQIIKTILTIQMIKTTLMIGIIKTIQMTKTTLMIKIPMTPTKITPMIGIIKKKVEIQKINIPMI